MPRQWTRSLYIRVTLYDMNNYVNYREEEEEEGGEREGGGGGVGGR